MPHFIRIFALAMMLAVFGNSLSAQVTNEDAIKKLALDAILENPEVIAEAIRILQARQEAANRMSAVDALNANRERLERDENAPLLGNPDGDVTIVEFFDYNCPYCKRVAPSVKEIMEEDGNIRVVYREWPVLGEGSVFAARAALASRNQGKYEEMHWALMDLGRSDANSVLATAKKLGLDIAQLQKDMNAPEVTEHINTSSELARALQFNGTPSFVIGEELVPGFIVKRQLASIVEKTRQ